MCLLHAAACDLSLEGCLGARLSHDMPRLSAMREETLIVYWDEDEHQPGFIGQLSYLRVRPDTAINLKQAGATETWRTRKLIQFILVTSAEVEEVYTKHPSIPNSG